MRDLQNLSLLELVPALRDDWASPYHLKEWTDCIERASLGNVRAMCSVPFQHYKSSTTLIGVVWLLLRNPKLKIILLTHSHEKAAAMGKELRELWKAAGGTMRKGFDTIAEWQTEQGGGCVVMSAAQSKLGYPCDLLLVDDPLDEKEYMQKEARDLADSTIALYTARAATHLNSVLIVASRWHPDDPIGRRLDAKAVKWEYFANPGIIDFGTENARAFAPDVLSFEQHLQMRAEWEERDPSLKIWWAQVQNDPRPDVLGMFRQPVRYQTLPEFGRFVFGIDLAYSDKPHADYFAMVVLKVWERVAYVVNVLRERRSLEMATDRIQFAQRTWPGASMWSYISGPEKGALQYLSSRNVMVEPIMARTPKYNRSQRTIDAWNLGKVRVPEQAPWLAGFLARVSLFTGNEAAGDDDEVDALVSACDGGVFGAGGAPKACGAKRRM